MAYCLGTFPKWLAYPLRWYCNGQPNCNVRLVFRGRRPIAGKWPRYKPSIPLSKAKGVAIYLESKEKRSPSRLQDEATDWHPRLIAEDEVAQVLRQARQSQQSDDIEDL